jgi:DNA-binding NarL/FixJ family response regulator
MVKIDLAIADDNELTRDALIKIFQFERDMDVVLVAENGADLLSKLAAIKPEIILMDINMPVMDGIEATKKVLVHYPYVKVIVHTQFDMDHNIIEMYRAGVKSFISKTGSIAELVNAIRLVHGGGSYITDKTLSIFKKYLEYTPTPKNKIVISEENFSKLSVVELRVLWHTASMKPIKQIASELHVSPHTINNHQYNLRKKFNLYGRNALVQYALSIRSQLSERLSIVES